MKTLILSKFALLIGRKSAIFVAIGVLSAVFAAYGEDDSLNVKYRSSFSYGLAVPSSPKDFSTYWKTGTILTWAEELEFVDLPVDARISIDIGWFDFNSDKFFDDVGYPSSRISLEVDPAILVNVDIMMKWFLIPSVRIPYVSAALGYSSIFGSSSRIYLDGYLYDQISGGENDALSFSIGTGVDIPVSVFKFYVDMRYTGLIGTGGYTAYFPIKFGISLPFSFIM